MMKGNRKRQNRQKADKRQFAVAYQKALERKYREKRLHAPSENQKHNGEYDGFHYLRINEDELPGTEYQQII